MARNSNRILQDLLHNDTEVTHNALKGLLKQPLNVLQNLTVTPTGHGSSSDLTNVSSTPVSVKCEYIIEDDAEETLENDDFEFQECKLEPQRDIEVNNDSNETDNSRESYSNDSNCFFCDVCNKMFYTKQKLVQHLKSHTGIEADHLKDHMQIHTADKPYSCQKCEKTFTLKCNLTKHIRIHNGEKPYSCQICGKSFTQRGTLTRHMLSHTGEKPYSCQKCEKKYTLKCSLTRHMLIHIGEKAYSCQRCGKTFTQKCHLTKHMHIYSGE